MRANVSELITFSVHSSIFVLNWRQPFFQPLCTQHSDDTFLQHSSCSVCHSYCLSVGTISFWTVDPFPLILKSMLWQIIVNRLKLCAAIKTQEEWKSSCSWRSWAYSWHYFKCFGNKINGVSILALYSLCSYYTLPTYLHTYLPTHPPTYLPT